MPKSLKETLSKIDSSSKPMITTLKKKNYLQIGFKQPRKIKLVDSTIETIPETIKLDPVDCNQDFNDHCDSNNDENDLQNCVKMKKFWCMPNSNTFEMKPIKDLLSKYIAKDMIVVDPMARNSKWAPIYSNDLNPDTDAKYHMNGIDFLEWLATEKKLENKVDIVLLDPPYSPRQISECYKIIGKQVTKEDTQNATLLKNLRQGAAKLLKKGGIAICFGWNSNGIGKKYGFIQKEIILIAHGASHNDTIVTIDQKL